MTSLVFDKQIMTKIIWNKNIEPQNRVEIEKYLNPFLWLVPSWAQTEINDLTQATNL
jgi:hypothetical protein